MPRVSKWVIGGALTLLVAATTGATMFIAYGHINAAHYDGLPPTEAVAARFLDEPGFVAAIDRNGTAPRKPMAPALSEPELDLALSAVQARVEYLDELRRNAVFNDAQIASIKVRLRLTPEQEQHWPPLEAALRAVTWKNRDARGVAVLDPDSVRNLLAAADTFGTQLREDQKREVRLLAHVVGLKVKL